MDLEMGTAKGKMSDRVVFITGAGSGIGRAMALLFAREGARVVAASRTPEHAEETARRAGGETLPLQVDVADAASVQRAVDQAIARFGRIDVLCNNAGVGTTKSVVEIEPDEWDQVFAVNVRGVYLCTRAVVPHMLAQGGGAIVNVASVLGFVGVPKRAAYCASKGAVISLTKQVAVEYAEQGIRCNCLCPGTVDSEWVERLLADVDDPAEARRSLAARHPLNRLGTPEEVAKAALYLASDDAAFITGSALVMDGGQAAR